MYRCILCGKSFSSDNLLREHILSEHLSSSPSPQHGESTGSSEASAPRREPCPYGLDFTNYECFGHLLGKAVAVLFWGDMAHIYWLEDGEVRHQLATYTCWQTCGYAFPESIVFTAEERDYRFDFTSAERDAISALKERAAGGR